MAKNNDNGIVIGKITYNDIKEQLTDITNRIEKIDDKLDKLCLRSEQLQQTAKTNRKLIYLLWGAFGTAVIFVSSILVDILRNT
jgi:hypothetical protein